MSLKKILGLIIAMMIMLPFFNTNVEANTIQNQNEIEQNEGLFDLPILLSPEEITNLVLETGLEVPESIKLIELIDDVPKEAFSKNSKDNDDFFETEMYPIATLNGETLYSSVFASQSNARSTVTNNGVLYSVNIAGIATYSTPIFMMNGQYVYCIQPSMPNATGSYPTQQALNNTGVRALLSHGFPLYTGGNSNNDAYVKTWIALNFYLHNKVSASYGQAFTESTIRRDGWIAGLLNNANNNTPTQLAVSVSPSSTVSGSDNRTGWYTVGGTANQQVQVTGLPAGASVEWENGKTTSPTKFRINRGTANWAGNISVRLTSPDTAGLMIYPASGKQAVGRPTGYRDPSPYATVSATLRPSTSVVTTRYVDNYNNTLVWTGTETVNNGSVINKTPPASYTHPETGQVFVPTTTGQTCNTTVNAAYTCTFNYRKQLTVRVNHLDIDTRSAIASAMTATLKQGDPYNYSLLNIAGYRPQPASQSFSGTTTTPEIQYASHPWGGPWQDFMNEGAMTGTTGQDKALEAFQVRLKDIPNVQVQYRSYNNNTSTWNPWITSGQSGAGGQRIGQIQMRLIGADAHLYKLEYQGHANNTGWESWKEVPASATAEVNMVSTGKVVQAFRARVTQRTGNNLTHDFTYKAQSVVTVQHRDVVSRAILQTETFTIDRNQVLNVSAKPNGHYTTNVNGANVPYLRETGLPTSVNITGTGGAITQVFDYRKEFTHEIIPVDGKNTTTIIAPPVTVKQLENSNYSYNRSHVHASLPVTWIESPKNQVHTGTANRNAQFYFYFKQDVPDPTVSVQIANPTNEVAFGGFVEWKLDKPTATNASVVVTEQNLNRTGNHYAVRNDFGAITNTTKNQTIIQNATVAGHQLKANTTATALKQQNIEFKAGYDFTNWFWQNYECIDRQDSFCFEWRYTNDTPDWSKVQSDQIAVTLNTDHKAGDIITSTTNTNLQLLVGQRQNVNGKTASAIQNSHERITLATPAQALATQTQLDMSSIKPTYTSDFNNPFYVTTGMKNVYVPDVMSELHDDYINTSQFNYGNYVMPLTYNATNGFQLGNHALAHMTTFQLIEGQNVETEYKNYTNGVTWANSGDYMRDWERAYYIPIEAESPLKPQETYQVTYQLGQMGLSDITLAHTQDFSFESYMFGHILDDPHYLIQVATPFSKSKEDYRYHYTMTPEQRAEIRAIDKELDRGFLHTWSRTNHGERSEALRAVLPDLPNHTD